MKSGAGLVPRFFLISIRDLVVPNSANVSSDTSGLNASASVVSFLTIPSSSSSISQFRNGPMFGSKSWIPAGAALATAVSLESALPLRGLFANSSAGSTTASDAGQSISTTMLQASFVAAVTETSMPSISSLSVPSAMLSLEISVSPFPTLEATSASQTSVQSAAAVHTHSSSLFASNNNHTSTSSLVTTTTTTTTQASSFSTLAMSLSTTIAVSVTPVSTTATKSPSSSSSSSSSSTSSSTSASAASGSKSHTESNDPTLSHAQLAGTISSAIVGAAVILIALYYLWHRRRKHLNLKESRLFDQQHLVTSKMSSREAPEDGEVQAVRGGRRGRRAREVFPHSAWLYDPPISVVGRSRISWFRPRSGTYELEDTQVQPRQWTNDTPGLAL